MSVKACFVSLYYFQKNMSVIESFNFLGLYYETTYLVVFSRQKIVLILNMIMIY